MVFLNDITSEQDVIPSELCISHTLEYAYADWCISRLAEQLGKREDAALYAAKGQAYRNIFDREKGWFREAYRRLRPAPAIRPAP